MSNNKVARAEPFVAQWQKGNILLLKGKWNNIFLTELEGFPDAFHDDQVYVASDAFAILANIGIYSALPNEELADKAATDFVNSCMHDMQSSWTDTIMEGIVIPAGWKLELLTSGSSRNFDTGVIIDRYDKKHRLEL